MLIFVDTEFTSFEVITQQLISIGLVSEDGKHEFYRENISHQPTFRSQFVTDVVVPLLEPEQYGLPFDVLRNELNDFLALLPTNNIEIVYDYFGDVELTRPMIDIEHVRFVLFQHALLRTLHERGVHTTTKIDDAFRELFVTDEPYYQIDPRQHHALVDAKANRHAFLRAMKAGMQ